jgi:uncharacterized glyoxalase superfamily protein PhnB
MRLSFNLEYFGECKNVINFYSSIFNNTSVSVKTFNEMPMADIFGISEQRLEMVWRAMLVINLENNSLCFEMSDSLMVAMNKGTDLKKWLYNPIICLTHNDENYIQGIFAKIYGNQHNFKELQNGTLADPHGIKWRCEKSSSNGIFYCLSFDGFCEDVIAYYENAFDIRATEIIRYADSPYADKVPAASADKIYSAIIKFHHGNQTCALKLSNSIDSAMNGTYGYDPNALLFYQGQHNPVFTVKHDDTAYLCDSFNRLKVGAKLNKEIMTDDDGIMNGGMIDKYGICWNFYSITGDSDIQQSLYLKNAVYE